ncbi:MAG: tetratricopeptide repeat protein [Chloroflexi bacterium]|nr:tetratricopeptide repeat protein [Chloroflexota bacterium]
MFAGGATLEAIEAVGQADGRARTKVLGTLEALVDKSLVVRDAEPAAAALRVRLLEPVREYALEQLAAAGDELPTRERHARFFTDLAQRVGRLVPDPTQVRHFAALEVEHDNLRAALAWYLERGTPEAAEAGLRLTGPLAAFWWTRGSFEEGARWCGAMLGQAGPLPVGSRPTSARIKTASAAGLLMTSRGEFGRARASLDLALDLARRAGESTLVVEALDYLGVLGLYQGDLAAARRWLEEALPLARDAGETGWEVFILTNLGRVALELDELGPARALTERALAVGGTLGAPLVASRSALLNLGRVAAREGEVEAALTHYREALRQMESVGSPHSVAVCLQGLADLVQQRGHWARAARLLGAADGLLATSGALLQVPDQQACERTFRSVRAQLGPARFAELVAVGRTLGRARIMREALVDEPSSSTSRRRRGGPLGVPAPDVAAPSAPGQPGRVRPGRAHPAPHVSGRPGCGGGRRQPAG